MIKYTELKKGLNTYLKTLYSPSEYSFYSGIEVAEGYTRPSFFTSLEAIDTELSNFCTSKNSFVYYIDFLQVETDEFEMLSIQTKLVSKFRKGFSIGDRHITPNDVKASIVKGERTVLEVAVDFTYYDDIIYDDDDKPEDADLMESFELNENTTN